MAKTTIVVYADESGTHDSVGNQTGSQFPVIAGFAARKSVWRAFCSDWGRVLRLYGATYFHSRELRMAREAFVHQTKKPSKELQKNIYYSQGWNLHKIESFRRSLAKVAADGDKIPIVGNVIIPAFNRIRTTLLDQDPYKVCMSHFFSVYIEETRLQWGNFADDVLFVFDQTDKRQWFEAIHEVFADYQTRDPRMTGPQFGDKKKARFWPLQAADLIAYRVRQLLEDYKTRGFEGIDLEPFDNLLLANLNKSGAIKYPELKKFLQ